jgi:hypothetical protein
VLSLSLSSLSPLYSSAIFSHPSAFGGAYSRIHQQWVVHALKHIPQQRLFVVTVRGECAFDWAFAWATFAFIVDRNCDVSADAQQVDASNWAFDWAFKWAFD